MILTLQVMLDRVAPGQLGLLPTLPLPRHLAAQANHHRRKRRPRHPIDLNFVIDPNHVPVGFLPRDVILAAARHLIFATVAMLSLLQRARTW